MLRINFLLFLEKSVNFSVILSSKRKMNSTSVPNSKQTLTVVVRWLNKRKLLILKLTLTLTLYANLIRTHDHEPKPWLSQQAKYKQHSTAVISFAYSLHSCSLQPEPGYNLIACDMFYK